MLMFRIYGRDGCVWCDKAASLLERQNRDFQYLKLFRDFDMVTFNEKTNNAKTVPQIFHGERLIGGYIELAEYLENTSGGFGDDFR